MPRKGEEGARTQDLAACSPFRFETVLLYDLLDATPVMRDMLSHGFGHALVTRHFLDARYGVAESAAVAGPSRPEAG
jgi:hypothetical protein